MAHGHMGQTDNGSIDPALGGPMGAPRAANVVKLDPLESGNPDIGSIKNYIDEYHQRCCSLLTAVIICDLLI